MTYRTRRYVATCALLGAVLAWAAPAAAQYGAADGEWRFYAGDGGHTQYTALDQVDAGNVADLEVAWRWRAENSDPRPFYNFEATPLMVGGVLYTSTGASEVDLSQELDSPGAQVRCVSSPIVSNDVVVSQVVPATDTGYIATPGHIRGYDVRTGERRSCAPRRWRLRPTTAWARSTRRRR